MFKQNLNYRQIALGLIIGIIIIIFISHCDSTPNNNSHRYFVPIGQEATLDSGSELVPVATTLAAFDEWIKAQVANDSHGRTKLFASGEVFGVEKGTKVLIIDEVTLRRKVRILNGEKEGLAGWVAVDYIK